MTALEPPLLPCPQRVELTGEKIILPETGVIALPVPHAESLALIAQRAQAALMQYAGVDWPVSSAAPATLTFNWEEGFASDDAYRLVITAGKIVITVGAAPGAFYAIATLAQLLQLHGRTLPALTIEDWPDFPARGVMLDISRDKVPTMETLYGLVDLFAGWKINQLQLYTEHTFAYRAHREVWEHASPMTPDEVRALDAYCRERFIELVPNQNSFGHMHRWFDHDRYRSLAEIDRPFRAPWGGTLPPFSLSPAAPEALTFLEGLYEELLPNFTSKQFNVGCDETFDLGLGRSRELVEQFGKGRVYLDFLLGIYRLVSQRGYTMQFWGDIINQYPELIPEIPNDAIALDWGYDDDYDFETTTQRFAESGLLFYVCPGTSSWNSLSGRTDNCIANIRNAARYGRRHGAAGLLNTDWGDHGHWQPLSVSYLGFAWGAALSWAYNANADADLPWLLDLYAFRDEARVMGRLAYDLGNIYQTLAQPGNLLFSAYVSPLKPELVADTGLRARLHTALAGIDEIVAPLYQARMDRADAALIQREFAHVAQMLRHGAKRALLQLEGSALSPSALAAELDAIIDEHRAVWLSRNRPGGLDDSAAKLAQARQLFEGEARAPIAE